MIPPPFLILTCVCNLKIYSPPDLALNIEDETASSYLATRRTCYLIRGNTSHRREGVDEARKKWNQTHVCKILHSELFGFGKGALQEIQDL